jgi:MerR family transcriptional regulator, light-induced transcriptional regulator
VHRTVLSTAEVARLFDVTETTVKRWADEGELKCQKTPGGHRKFEIRQVIEFAEEKNFEPVAALELPDSDALADSIRIAIITRDYPKLVEAFVSKALSPDTKDLYRFLVYLYEHKIALWEIYDLILRPGMHRIGAQWERGEIEISHEHRASAETMDAIAKLQTQIYIKPSTGKSALFACLDAEMHEIGLRTAVNLFEAEGWHTYNLGARTPFRSLLATIEEIRPDVVCLSITRQENVPDLPAKIAALSALLRSCDAQLAVGGACIDTVEINKSLIDAFLHSSRDLLDYVSGLSRPTGNGKAQ